MLKIIIAGGPQNYLILSYNATLVFLMKRKENTMRIGRHLAWLTVQVSAYHEVSSDGALFSILGKENSNVGHIECSRGSQVPHAWIKLYLRSCVSHLIYDFNFQLLETNFLRFLLVSFVNFQLLERRQWLKSWLTGPSRTKFLGALLPKTYGCALK